MLGRIAAGSSLAVTLVVASAIAAGPTELRRQTPQVGCSFSSSSATAAVRVRGERFDIPLPEDLGDRPANAQFVLPGAVSIQRRGDGISASPGLRRSGSPVACRGGPATVANTDTLRIVTGGDSEIADLSLDLRYGGLEPGLTDEADGGSEIEIEANLGGGIAFVTGARETDAITATTGNAVSAINLNAAEPVADDDVDLRGPALLWIDGGGSADRLALSGGASAPVVALGGQGDDLVTGTDATDLLSGGPGADGIEGGPGRDLIFALDRGTDRVDCGAGADIVFAHGSRERLHACERTLPAPRLSRAQLDVVLLFVLVLGPALEAAVDEPSVQRIDRALDRYAQQRSR